MGLQRHYYGSGSLARGLRFPTAMAVCGCMLLLNYFGVKAASPPPPPNKGVQIVAGSSTAGRLELYIAGLVPAWVPVCKSAESNLNAQIFCSALGYTYGRSYYSQPAAYPVPQNYTLAALEVKCSTKRGPPVGRRRQLRNGRAPAATARSSGGDVAEAFGDGGSDRLRHDRSAIAVMRAAPVGLPSTFSYECTATIGGCPGGDFYMGPFAGIECSNMKFPPAPKPPPSPPPPPPPIKTNDMLTIRMYGGDGIWSSGPLEPNLCTNVEGCGGRVELRVTVQAGVMGPRPATIWAPLCEVKASLRERVAYTVCQQLYGWPDLRPMPAWNLGGIASDPAPLPQGLVTKKGHFNPANYPGWVTITNLRSARPISLQNGTLSVSKSPCAKLFILSCYAIA